VLEPVEGRSPFLMDYACPAGSAIFFTEVPVLWSSAREGRALSL
jgi:hypothetical protein